MKKNKRSSSCIWILISLFLLAAAGLVVLFFTGYLATSRTQSTSTRPLVLIVNPLNHDSLTVGRGTLVHAVARARQGIRRMELWVDNVLVDQVDHSASPGQSMVLSSSYEPKTRGEHILVVRAFTSDNKEGQGTITIEAEELAAEGTALVHVVEESETFESIADAYGVSPEELADANPATAPESIAPGDSVEIPAGGGGDSAPGEDAPPVPLPVPPAGEEPPVPVDEAGGTGIELVNMFFMDLSDRFSEASAEPQGIKFEVLSLASGQAYESLHCYSALAGGTARWYPDRDGDQTTDESFASADSLDWDVAAELSGPAAPVITWPGDQTLNVEMSCIGIQGGGTDALELGHVVLELPPSSWDGVLRTASSLAGEGSYAIEYRVTSQDVPHGFPIDLDPLMMPPYNLRFDDRRYALRWDHQPGPEEEYPIDGFRVYLNDNLMWTERAGVFFSDLPMEWFTPPCGSEYRFTVTSYRYYAHDLYESPLSEAATIVTPEFACRRQILVNFLTLRTFTLPGDGTGRHDPGDNGPVYGNFYARDQIANFDGRDEHWGGMGINNNSEYPILGDHGLTTSLNWWSDARASFSVQIGEGEQLVLGYRIMDEDTGIGSDNDLTCSGELWIPYDDVDQRGDRTIRADNDACEVVVNLSMTGGPVGEGGSTWPTMPWLEISNLAIDESTGRTTFTLTNEGDANWPYRDLEIAVTQRDGTIVGESIYTFNEFSLEPSFSRDMEHPDMVFGANADVCLTVDPNNQVPEIYETTGAYHHVPFCLQRPDLVIRDVLFDSGASPQILVTVRNRGEQAMPSRSLSIQARLPDGGAAFAYRSWPAITMEPNETRVFTLTGISDSVRELMRGGYDVEVNSDRTVFETDYDNNIYHSSGTLGNFWLTWHSTCGPEDVFGVIRTREAHLVGDVIGGSSSRRVFTENHDSRNEWCINPNTNTQVFEMADDEQLRITAGLDLTIDGRHYDLGQLLGTFDLNDPEEYVEHWRGQQCMILDESGHHSMTRVFEIQGHRDYWNVYYTICKEIPR